MFNVRRGEIKTSFFFSRARLPFFYMKIYGQLMELWWWFEWQKSRSSLDFILALRSRSPAVILCLSPCNCVRPSQMLQWNNLRQFFLAVQTLVVDRGRRWVRMNGEEEEKSIKIAIKEAASAEKHQRNSQNVIQITISSRSTFSVDSLLILSFASWVCVSECGRMKLRKFLYLITARTLMTTTVAEPWTHRNNR